MLELVILRVLMVAFFILANSFFVAAEFAIVSVRETRMQQLVALNRPGARTALGLKHSIDEFLPAVQFGVTLASLALEMQLDGGHVWQRTIRPALPTTDRKFLLKLLQLEIGAQPPQSAVLSLTLSAQAGQSSKVQLGLFTPPTPEPSRLDVTIARLKAIAGEDRVGCPVLEDTHRPGSFRMENFTVANPTKAQAVIEAPPQPRMALRRIRPPTQVRVQLESLKPAAFRDLEQSYKVAAAYGPWRSSGCWWSTDPWSTEEWDVLAESSSGASLACLLVHNCTQNNWQLEAIYD